MKRMFNLFVVLGLVGMAPLGWAGSGEQIVTGTGNFTTQVTRVSETLQPPCVQLVTRQGQAEFSGFITNTLECTREQPARQPSVAGRVRGPGPGYVPIGGPPERCDGGRPHR